MSSFPRKTRSPAKAFDVLDEPITLSGLKANKVALSSYPISVTYQITQPLTYVSEFVNFNNRAQLPAAKTPGETWTIVTNSSTAGAGGSFYLYPPAGNNFMNMGIDAVVQIGNYSVSRCVYLGSNLWVVETSYIKSAQFGGSFMDAMTFANGFTSTSTTTVFGGNFNVQFGQVDFTNTSVIVAKKYVVATTTNQSPSTALSGKGFTNLGASSTVTITLPASASLVIGIFYSFSVAANHILRITANTGQTIRIGGTVSALAGSVESNVIGSTLTIYAVDTTHWIALDVNGTWSGAGPAPNNANISRVVDTYGGF